MVFGCDEKIILDQCLPPIGVFAKGPTVAAPSAVKAELPADAAVGSAFTEVKSDGQRINELLQRGDGENSASSILTRMPFECVDQFGRMAQVHMGAGIPVDSAIIDGERICSVQSFISGECISDRCAEIDFPEENYLAMKRDGIDKNGTIADGTSILTQMIYSQYSFERGLELFKRILTGSLIELSGSMYEACSVAIAKGQSASCSSSEQRDAEGVITKKSILCERPVEDSNEDLSIQYTSMRFSHGSEPKFCRVLDSK